MKKLISGLSVLFAITAFAYDSEKVSIDRGTTLKIEVINCDSTEYQNIEIVKRNEVLATCKPVKCYFSVASVFRGGGYDVFVEKNGRSSYGRSRKDQSFLETIESPTKDSPRVEKMKTMEKFIRNRYFKTNICREAYYYSGVAGLSVTKIIIKN